MNFQALSYSKERNGTLENYLKEFDGVRCDNLFYGPKSFNLMRDLNLLIPDKTWIRLFSNMGPDKGYIVNSDFRLESNGSKCYNMSLIAGEKGVYSSQDLLSHTNWSIYMIDYSKLF